MSYSNVTPPTLPDYNPVSGYSYNGTVLPDINTVWTDKESYPSAIISKDVYNTSIMYLTICASVASGEAGFLRFYSPYCKYKLVDGDEEWTYVGGEDIGNDEVYGLSADPLWTTTDLYSQRGHVLYLSASDPVPIQPYPYSVIAYNYEKGAEDWYQAHLCYSATPFTWNGEAVVNSGTTYKRIYDAELDAWTDEAETEIEATPGLDGTVYQRIYTDHDILDSTGAVWLAAGQVTPVEETGVSDTWKYSFKLGLALALCGKPLPIVRKLIGYSYNGTVLPKLPEWDRETYPYAFILYTASTYRLFATKTAVTVSTTEYITVPSTSIQSVMPNGGTEWGTFTELSDELSYSARKLVWCKSDMSGADGNIYLRATEPIPVYE